MNKQPVVYMQTDPRWANKDYSAPGESTTIGKSGCGPTCAAMLVETLTGKTFTPADACAWSAAHGYKALNQGTYYSYFVPQFKEFGIECQQLNSVSLYGNSASAAHDKAFDLLKQGYYLIACMGKGLWTSSGHFIVVWWEDGKVRINDPASTKTERLNGDLATFKAQVKYYWAVDAREYNNGSDKKEDDDIMTGEQIVKALTPEMCLAIVQEARGPLQDNDSNTYSAEAREWSKETGLVQGGDSAAFNGMWEDFLTREQAVTLHYREYNLIIAKVQQMIDAAATKIAEQVAAKVLAQIGKE